MKIIKDKNYLLTIDLLVNSIIISEHLTEQDAILAKIDVEKKILDLLLSMGINDDGARKEKLKSVLISWAKTATKPITSTEMMYMVTKNTNIWKSFRDKDLDIVLQEIKSEHGIQIVKCNNNVGSTKSWVVAK